jgi:hypothetical protein
MLHKPAFVLLQSSTALTWMTLYHMAVVCVCDPCSVLAPVIIPDATLIPPCDDAEVLLGSVMMKEAGLLSCVMFISCDTTTVSLLFSWDLAVTELND